MRNVLLCGVLALAGCGASAAEVRSAQAARYKYSPSELYEIAKQTAADDYRIGEDDPEGHRFATVPQWYTAEGGRESAGGGDYVQLSDHSVNLSLVVSVVPAEGGTMKFDVEPEVQQFLSGSPQPRKLAADDPNMPGWVTGRVESLQLAIHKNAKGFELERTGPP